MLYRCSILKNVKVFRAVFQTTKVVGISKRYFVSCLKEFPKLLKDFIFSIHIRFIKLMANIKCSPAKLPQVCSKCAKKQDIIWVLHSIWGVNKKIKQNLKQNKQLSLIKIQTINYINQSLFFCTMNSNRVIDGCQLKFNTLK